MKTIQLEAHKTDNDLLLRAAGVRRIHAGWYTVTYNGVDVDPSNVTGATRNPKGKVKL